MGVNHLQVRRYNCWVEVGETNYGAERNKSLNSCNSVGFGLSQIFATNASQAFTFSSLLLHTLFYLSILEHQTDIAMRISLAFFPSNRQIGTGKEKYSRSITSLQIKFGIPGYKDYRGPCIRSEIVFYFYFKDR